MVGARAGLLSLHPFVTILNLTFLHADRVKNLLLSV